MTKIFKSWAVNLFGYNMNPSSFLYLLRTQLLSSGGRCKSKSWKTEGEDEHLKALLNLGTVQ
jgi:hypothetical protein